MVLWGMAHGTSDIERGVDIPIVFEGVPEDLVLVEQSARAVNIRVLGSRAALRDVGPSRVDYRVDVSGAQAGTTVVEVDPGVIGAQLPRGARVVSRSPASLELSFGHRGRKSLRVKADLVGEPAPGYQVSWVEVEPAAVWLTGERRVVQRMAEAATEGVEIRGLTAPIEREVRLSLPDRVWMEEQRTLSVRVQIEPDASPEGAAGPVGGGA